MSEVYNFKPLSEVEVQEEPTDATTVLAVEDGTVKQIPAGKFGGGAAGFLVALTLGSSDMEIASADKTFMEVLTAVETGAYPVARLYVPNTGFLYAPILQVMPGEGVVFLVDAFGTTMQIVCTADDTWMLQPVEGV